LSHLAVHLVGSASRRAAGLFHSVRGMAIEQSRIDGCRVAVMALEDDYSVQDYAEWEPIEPSLIKQSWPGGLGISREWFLGLRRTNPDVLHAHGLWMFHSLACMLYAGQTKKPYVVSPHGMLEPRAFGMKAWKKKPVWMTWERRVVHNAAVLHCTSEIEGRHLRERGFRQPLAVIPNGTQLPPDFGDRRATRRERVVLFLSRIHPIKGLIELVDAWKLLKPKGWRLRIVGPDDHRYSRVIARHAVLAGVAETIEFSEAVYGDSRWAAMHDADLFILPSLSENFGNVVAEALVSGVPVITTTATPWKALPSRGCGWYVEPQPESLAMALEEAIGLSDAERWEMGSNGRTWATSEFSWPKIAREIWSVYEWILGRGPRPACVRLD